MLTDREKRYIQKLVSGGNSLSTETMSDVINSKRDPTDPVSSDEILGYIGTLSILGTETSAQQTEVEEDIGDISKQSGSGGDLRAREQLDLVVAETEYVVAQLLARLSPRILDLVAPKPKDYCIVSGKYQPELTNEVKKLMQYGWQPLGGVGAAAFGMSPVGGNQYVQAMVKY